jgi:ketosteroid isomerase-like protein
MDFAALIERMTGAAARGAGAEVGACFTEDGVYHDVFYGAHQGRAAIARMIEECFHRDGEDFRWDIHDPVASGEVGYARYTFSYTSKLPESAGRRAMFEGVAICRLRDGLIAEYRELADVYPAFSLLGFPDARLARFAARQARELWDRAGPAHRGT